MNKALGKWYSELVSWYGLLSLMSDARKQLLRFLICSYNNLPETSYNLSNVLAKSLDRWQPAWVLDDVFTVNLCHCD